MRRAPSAQRVVERTPKRDLSDQLALVDAAHRALRDGDAASALALARKYQTEYPTGTFRPEAAAIRIEALGKLGRTAEAHALAGSFAKTYGPGPLADRVAALAGTTQQ
jgi:outer membrane protein assembly factor BamD (BamD/ComL family)